MLGEYAFHHAGLTERVQGFCIAKDALPERAMTERATSANHSSSVCKYWVSISATSRADASWLGMPVRC